jgi:hypothetical protein
MTSARGHGLDHWLQEGLGIFLEGRELQRRGEIAVVARLVGMFSWRLCHGAVSELGLERARQSMVR